MRKDLDYQSQMLDTLKAERMEYAKMNELQKMMSTFNADQNIQTNDKVRDLHQQIVLLLEEKLKPLENVPNSKEFVRQAEYKIFVEQFRYLRDSVERATDTLLLGYKTEANHILNSKIQKEEVKEMMLEKYDRDKGLLLEKEIKLIDKKQKVSEVILEELLTNMKQLKKWQKQVKKQKHKKDDFNEGDEKMYSEKDDDDNDASSSS